MRFFVERECNEDDKYDDGKKFSCTSISAYQHLRTFLVFNHLDLETWTNKK